MKKLALKPTDLVVISGCQYTGKTTLLIDVINNIALKNKEKVLIFSLEYNKTQFIQKMLCRYTNIPMEKLANGMSDKEKEILAQTMEQLDTASIYIEDKAEMFLGEIISKCCQAKKKYKKYRVDYNRLFTINRTKRL